MRLCFLTLSRTSDTLKQSPAHPRPMQCTSFRSRSIRQLVPWPFLFRRPGSCLRQSSSVPPIPRAKVTDDHALQAEERAAYRLAKKRQEFRDNLSQGSQKLEHDDRIDVASLSRTLDLHREDNQNKIKIYRPSKSRVYDNDFTKADAFILQKVQPHIQPTKHLQLRRVETSRSQPIDYKSNPRPLFVEWEVIGDVPRYIRLPWMRELDRSDVTWHDATVQLSKEIQEAGTYFTPDQKEATAARHIYHAIRTTALKACSWIVDVPIIGSRASGLDMPLSDIDVNLVVDKDHNYSDLPLTELKQVYKTLKSHHRDPRIRAVYLAKQAVVPVLMGESTRNALKFQIQKADSAFGSLQVAKHLQVQHPSINVLYKVLKHALAIRRLTTGFNGGLTSYPLLVMIATSLKMHERNLASRSTGQQLLNFLTYFSTFDFYTKGITHIPSLPLQGALEKEGDDKLQSSNLSDLVAQDPIGAIPVEFNVCRKLGTLHEPKDNFKMVLHDPANLYNDLGSGCYWIKDIQATFADILRKVKADMSEWDSQRRAGTITKIKPSLLRSLIEADYSIYNLERSKLRESSGDIHPIRDRKSAQPS